MVCYSIISSSSSFFWPFYSLRVLAVTTIPRHFSLSWAISYQSSIPIVFRSSVIPSIHLYLGRPLGRFPVGFHSKATHTGSFSFLLRICLSHWILWPLMKLVSGARFIIFCSSIVSSSPTSSSTILFSKVLIISSIIINNILKYN